MITISIGSHTQAQGPLVSVDGEFATITLNNRQIRGRPVSSPEAIARATADLTVAV